MDREKGDGQPAQKKVFVGMFAQPFVGMVGANMAMGPC